MPSGRIEAQKTTPSVAKVQTLASYLGVTGGDLIGEARPAERGELLAPDEQRVILWYRALPEAAKRALLAMPDVPSGPAGA